jgi:hypothetical protein
LLPYNSDTYPAGKLDRRNALLVVPEEQFYR